MSTRNGPVVADHNRASTRQGDSADGSHLIRQLEAQQAKPGEWHADLRYCVDHFHLLNDWECDFVLGLAGYSHPSAKQRDKLAIIVAKVKLALTVSRRRAAR